MINKKKMYLCTFINKKNLLVMKVNIPKSETPKFVSNAKNRISKSMGKILSLIPVSLLVGGAIVVSFLFATGCKKGTNCPDGYDHSIMTSPPKYAMADDPCEEERNAVMQSEADSAAWTQYVRDRFADIDTTVILRPYFWNSFDNRWPQLPRNNIFDSAVLTRLTAEWLWENKGNPLPVNDNELRLAYNGSGRLIGTCDTLIINRGLLEQCESNVGITEYEWVKDDCGGYWTIK